MSTQIQRNAAHLMYSQQYGGPFAPDRGRLSQRSC